MKKTGISYKIFSFILIFTLSALAGCSRENKTLTDKPGTKTQPAETQIPEEITQTEEPPVKEVSAEELLTNEAPQTAETIVDEVQEEITEPTIVEADWSDYFDGINGAAVIYDPTEKCYQIYNQELALTQRSPCSTFKIISSLTALENGIIDPNNSIRTWSGEIFWNEDWNKDIDFSDAFHASCVWYFREVIDEIGEDVMQAELDKLQYGNCDISDWKGHLNTNNNNPALTGFWIESSLLISPKEQVEVLERIFGDYTDYSEETLNQLKQVMLLSEQSEADISIYGKTGMGKANGIVIDSWFTGFADIVDKRIYFCVYLGETDNANVSSAKAREIAVEIVFDYL
ncbi:MAG: class D beta-lactamase [Lachnospiraceae bacterium]|nr:class D beta-lactamase [Lachnospiraceae bacterium]